MEGPCKLYLGILPGNASSTSPPLLQANLALCCGSLLQRPLQVRVWKQMSPFLPLFCLCLPLSLRTTLALLPSSFRHQYMISERWRPFGQGKFIVRKFFVESVRGGLGGQWRLFSN